MKNPQYFLMTIPPSYRYFRRYQELLENNILRVYSNFPSILFYFIFLFEGGEGWHRNCIVLNESTQEGTFTNYVRTLRGLGGGRKGGLRKSSAYRGMRGQFRSKFCLRNLWTSPATDNIALPLRYQADITAGDHVIICYFIINSRKQYFIYKLLLSVINFLVVDSGVCLRLLSGSPAAVSMQYL